MNRDAGLVITLVERLTTRLPHRTGSYSHDLLRDEIVVLTRATLVNISNSCIGDVIDTLVRLLHDLARPYKGINAHPVHVLHSELYVFGLLAECCSTHWASINRSRPVSEEADGRHSDSESSNSENGSKDVPSLGDDARRSFQNKLHARDIAPDPLDDTLVGRLLDAIKLFSIPISDSYVLPASNILDDVFKGVTPGGKSWGTGNTVNVNGQHNATEASRLLQEKSDDIEVYTRGVVEYV